MLIPLDDDLTRMLPRRPFDVCIVGAGAAGITLALELSRTGLDTCVLEGGASSPDAESQSLYRGYVSGHYSEDLDTCRTRRLGGSTNCWPGTCTPLEPLDFEFRPWVSDAAWPIAFDEIAAHYAGAARYCALQASPLPHTEQVTALGRQLASSVWTTRLAQRSTAPRMGERYAAELAAAPNVTVVLGANVVHIGCDARGTRVAHVVVRPWHRPPFRLQARLFVLATGGLENARLLLASNDVHMRGIGNRHDLVGRCFMEHPVLHSIVLRAAGAIECESFGDTPVEGSFGMHYLQLRPEVVRAMRTTNVRVHVSPMRDFDMARAMFAYRFLRLSLRRRQWPSAAARRVLLLAAGSPAVGAHLVARLRGAHGRRRESPPGVRRISIMAEQLPDPRNRVTLTSARDALGLPRLRLEWRMSQREQSWARQHIDLLASAFRTCGVGEVRDLSVDRARPFDERLDFGNHAIGTTRAARDPRQGVVDGDGRVFGIDNLYVAGSSVFPTSSHLPPTLSLVALAIRLGAHLAAVAGTGTLDSRRSVAEG